MLFKYLTLFVLLLVGTQTYAQFDTLQVKRALNGDTWEWKIENWDSNQSHDLVVDYTFTEDGKFTKYQRVETKTRPYNEVKSFGTWKKNGKIVVFSGEAEGSKIVGEFNSELNPSIFKFKIYKMDGKTLIKEFSREYVKLRAIKRF
jgi:hypothetical protein